MLMMIKTPITDADSIRALACRALAGLARCEKVRQIVSKLPVLSNGSMQGKQNETYPFDSFPGSRPTLTRTL